MHRYEKYSNVVKQTVESLNENGYFNSWWNKFFPTDIGYDEDELKHDYSINKEDENIDMFLMDWVAEYVNDVVYDICENKLGLDTSSSSDDEFLVADIWEFTRDLFIEKCYLELDKLIGA
jgi:hypothetical protein